MIFIFVRLMRGAQVIGLVRCLYFYLLASVERAAEFWFFSFSLGADFANSFPSTMEFCVKMRLFGGQRMGRIYIDFTFGIAAVPDTLLLRWKTGKY
jgi:hypothetical protein